VRLPLNSSWQGRINISLVASQVKVGENKTRARERRKEEESTEKENGNAARLLLSEIRRHNMVFA